MPGEANVVADGMAAVAVAVGLVVGGERDRGTGGRVRHRAAEAVGVDVFRCERAVVHILHFGDQARAQIDVA